MIVSVVGIDLFCVSVIVLVSVVIVGVSLLVLLL